MADFVSYENVDLADGFWLDRYNLNKKVSMKAVQNRFEESGRFEGLRFTHGKDSKKLHIYYDSDVAKWIEAVAYLAQKDADGMKEYLEFCDELIDSMEKHQRADGYLNSYFQQCASDKIYSNRDWHELYCSGHLLEAAIAYAKATGKEKFLDVMKRNMECIYQVFLQRDSAEFMTPGHEEIELALFRLYEYCGDEKYKKMAEYFLEKRANNDKDKTIYEDAKDGCQDNADIYHLTEAKGHSVRALYLLCGVADMARINGDEVLLKNLDAVWSDIVDKKMYVTGEVGSTHRGESFTVEYDLPNQTAYAESCCAIAFILFALRMRKIKRRADYGALIERVMYNSLLSSTSLDGKAFFYENPLEIIMEDLDRETAVSKPKRERLPIRERLEVFSCSCCPPNINRMFGRIGDVICFEDDDALAVEQYVACAIKSKFGSLNISGDYIGDGKMTISSSDYTGKVLRLRVPEWCKSYTVCVDGKQVAVDQNEGYVCVKVGKKFDLSINFEIAPRFVRANPKVRANAGRVALLRGPMVYCIEGVDNGERLNRICVEINEAKNATCYKDFHGSYSIEMTAYKDCADDRLYYDAAEWADEPIKLKFIPYYAFANRGETDMQVWIRKR